MMSKNNTDAYSVSTFIFSLSIKKYSNFKLVFIVSQFVLSQVLYKTILLMYDVFNIQNTLNLFQYHH